MTMFEYDDVVHRDRVTKGAASFQKKSHNGKLTRVAWDPVADPRYPQGRPRAVRPYVCSTSVSIEATCPSSCSFKNNGCFAQEGVTRVQGKKHDAAAQFADPSEVIEEEARLIERAFVMGHPKDGARGGRDLRLHVAGDVPNAAGARRLALAAAHWRKWGGGSVWTYTHRWRSIPRSAWGSISVLASCETTEDVRAAVERGYAPSLVVERLPGRRAVPLRGLPRGWKLQPCPAETGNATCASCRLCLDRDLVKLRRVISFEVHGRGAARAAQGLVQLRMPV